MALMEWKDSYSVGVKQLDNDHKKLIALLNQLYDGIHAGQTKEIIGPVLDQLVRYTKTHFTREEELFARTGYPATEAHIREHHGLLTRAAEFQKRYEEGQISMLSLETMSFLKNWLNHHISESDRSYKAHMAQHGIR